MSDTKPTSSAVLVAVGSSKPQNKKGEKFEDGAWSDIQDAPLRTKFSDYAVVYNSGNFYYFGGWDNPRVNMPKGDISSILCLNSVTWTWSNVGQLNRPRSQHQVILVGNTFMVLGGWYEFANEACILNNGKFTCEEKTTRLIGYVSRPLLFLVDDSIECTKTTVPTLTTDRTTTANKQSTLNNDNYGFTETTVPSASTKVIGTTSTTTMQPCTTQEKIDKLPVLQTFCFFVNLAT